MFTPGLQFQQFNYKQENYDMDLKNRPMRRATQHRVDQFGNLEEYQIDVPVEYTQEEWAGLQKQFNARHERAKAVDEKPKEKIS